MTNFIKAEWKLNGGVDKISNRLHIENVKITSMQNESTKVICKK